MHWRVFELERTGLFDRIMSQMSSAVEAGWLTLPKCACPGLLRIIISRCHKCLNPLMSRKVVECKSLRAGQHRQQRAVDVLAGRDCHSSTSQITLSRFCH